MPKAAAPSLRLIVIDLHRRDVPTSAICEAFGVAKSTAYRWINEAFFDRLPHPSEFALRLEHDRCEHDPIRVGELTVCPTCCKSGYDHHPAMQAKPLPRERKRYRPPSDLRGGV